MGLMCPCSFLVFVIISKCMFVLLDINLCITGGSKVTPKKDNWDLPPMEDIDPELLRPVLDDSK